MQQLLFIQKVTPFVNSSVHEFNVSDNYDSLILVKIIAGKLFSFAGRKSEKV